MAEQAELNQGIATKLEQLTAQRAASIRETVREIYTCSRPAMRAATVLLCALSVAACATAETVRVVALSPPDRLLQACQRPDDRPDAGDDRQLAAWEAETWQRGHDCADQVEGWHEWWSTRAAK
jgi:hypothetical protein